MSVIHMEVEQVESTLATLKRMHETWEYATDLRNKIASLQGGGWQGPSAEEFFYAYNDVVRQFASQTQALFILIQRLSRELAEWQQADLSFSTGEGAGADVGSTASEGVSAAVGGTAAAGAGAAAGNDPATGASSGYSYSGDRNVF